MAHFAKIDDNNLVLQVLTVDDSNAATEAAGQTYLNTNNNWPAAKWIQTSYNTEANVHKLSGTPFRGNFANIGDTYDDVNEIFWRPQPYASWTKDIATASWVPPITQPTITSAQHDQNVAGTHGWKYDWDESAYQADTSDPKTIGWVLTDGLA